MKFCLILALSIFRASLVTSEKKLVNKSLQRQKSDSRFENKAGVVPSSSSEDVNALLQEVKRELKAEFQTEMNELKSQFKEELQRQREEMTLLKAQHEKLIRQCQHSRNLYSDHVHADKRQDSTTKTQASASDDVVRQTRSDDLGPLETVVAQATQRLDQMDADIRALQTRDTELQTAINAENQAIGTTYIRWGSNSCSTPSELVYSGILGGGHYNSAGAPPNHLCLTPNPVYDDIPFPNLNPNSVYGSEYDMATTDPKYQTTPACAVCRIPRLSIIMIPGTNQCESGWHLEYSGHLMAGPPQYAGSNEYICVDSKQDYLPGTQQNDDQNALHLVQTACGALGCPPYQNNKIATCVLCSK